MDNELFELCKEVYEKTNLNDGYLNLRKYSDNSPVTMADVFDGSITNIGTFPLYTSDYLLERIIKGGGVIRSATSRRKARQFLAHGGGKLEYGDTPLKALLKLVIALDDAGVKL